MKARKQQLEIFLQKIPPYPHPKPFLEQYQTPPSIASDVLFIAYGLGDIVNKKVLDLGCGTGIFAIGASLLGAEEVVGVDIDKECLEIAEQASKELKCEVKFVHSSISEFFQKVDTCLMNPPFGAQKANRNIDRAFIKKGIESSKVIYSLHFSKTVDFIKKFLQSFGASTTFTKNYSFSIPHQFSFHLKEKKEVSVTLFRIRTTQK
jgi:putative methylase